MTKKTVTVDADALYKILQALVGPGHLIRELQFTRSLHKMGHPNPIDILIEEYEADAKKKDVVDLPAGSMQAIQLNIIRRWPDGFQARLEHVWKDVIGFIPGVKLWDLQRTLAEFGFRMEVYETKPATDEYFLQDTRSYVGNCPMWWGIKGGYTSRIDRARRYTLADAMKQHVARDTDLPWACAEIELLQRPTIDMQELPRSNAGQAAALIAMIEGA